MAVDLNLKSFFIRGNTLPRWTVLVIDLCLIYFTFSFTFLLVEQIQFSELSRGTFLIYTFLFCFISFVTSISMRLYRGLLRYSNMKDMLRVFVFVLVSSIIFLFCAQVILPLAFTFTFKHLYHFIILNFFITSCALILFRTVAKLTFHSLLKRSGSKVRKNVLIYGSGQTALFLKQALEGSDQASYQIMGFVDHNGRVNTAMEQKKVYHYSKLTSLYHKKRIDELIIVNDKLTEANKMRMINLSLSIGLPVSVVPPIQKWLSGKDEKEQVRKLRIEDLLQREAIQIDQVLVKEDLNKKCILITGAAGSIGSELAKQILKYEPALLVLCDQAESPLHELQLSIEEHFPNVSIRVVISDVRCYDRMHHVFEQYAPEVIFHAAAYKHVPLMEGNPLEAVCSNVLGTKNIADLAIKFNTDKFVMISTDKAVNPTNVMGTTKRIAEIYIQSLNGRKGNTRFITTRFGNVLGSNGSVIPRFNKQIEKGGPVTVTHPNITRFFMTVSEAVQLVLQAGTMGLGGEIFVFDMGESVKIVDLAKKMIQLAGYEEGKDIHISYTGLRPGEKLFEELLSATEHTLPTYHPKINIAKVRVYDLNKVSQKINDLLYQITQKEPEMIVLKMKEIVPEFISNNSPFEKLDKEGPLLTI